MDKGFTAIAEEYKKQFMQSSGNDWLANIGRFKTVRWCLTTLYSQMLRHGEIEPIENLSEEEGQKLWEAAKELSETKTKNECIEICRALHAFGTFLQV